MLGFPTYRVMHRDAKIFTQRSDKPLEYDPSPEKISKDADLTEDQMMLCPPNIQGYLLREKKWGTYLLSRSISYNSNNSYLVNLLVDNVFPVTWKKDAFKRFSASR